MSKLDYIFQISKSGKQDGPTISFFSDEKKSWQDNWKNDLLNGIYKQWWGNSKNWFFGNSKKDKRQGIQIIFK